MECANHSERGAVAKCSACGKGLCLECATELDGVFSCRGECESALRVLVDATRRSERKTKRVAGAAMSVLCLLGALACFGVASKDIWTTQRANMDEDGNFRLEQPVSAPVTTAQKTGYTACGLFFLAGGLYGLVATGRLKCYAR